MIGKSQDTISINNVREITSDDEVVSKYFNITAIPSIILSPLRKKK